MIVMGGTSNEHPKKSALGLPGARNWPAPLVTVPKNGSPDIGRLRRPAAQSMKPRGQCPKLLITKGFTEEKTDGHLAPGLCLLDKATSELGTGERYWF